MAAAIDVGSNSILLLVTDTGGKVLHDEARVVGLGRGLADRGVFQPDRMEAALATLGDYVRRAAELGVPAAEISAVATSASRRARNSRSFYHRVREATGLRVEVISGEEEARLTWLGALDGIELPAGPVSLIDTGGGSTEVIHGLGADLRARVSLEIGTVRLTDAHLGYGVMDPAALARLRTEVDAAMALVPVPQHPRLVVATAGTATTLMACELGLTRYDPTRVHGGILTNAAVRSWIDRLLEASPKERRKIVPSSPDRADTLLAGATILSRFLEHVRKTSLCVSDRGLRFGVLRARDPTANVSGGMFRP